MNNFREYVIESTDLNRIVIVTDIHNCHLDWHDMPTYDRMELMCQEINKEYDKRPFDAILSLGDYSLDFWLWEIGGTYLWKNPIS